VKFAEHIAEAQMPAAAQPEQKRPVVKEWKLDDLGSLLESGLKQKRNLANGRMLYTAANCITCHSFQGDGGFSGPDLSNVGGRYTPRDLLENILLPSKMINEQYGQGNRSHPV
jgi:mono/diheme cytochrome c family protein